MSLYGPGLSPLGSGSAFPLIAKSQQVGTLLASDQGKNRGLDKSGAAVSTDEVWMASEGDPEKPGSWPWCRSRGRGSLARWGCHLQEAAERPGGPEALTWREAVSDTSAHRVLVEAVAENRLQFRGPGLQQGVQGELCMSTPRAAGGVATSFCVGR